MVQQIRSTALSLALVFTSLLTGCNQSLNSISPSAPPSALTPSASEPVATGQLPPINTQPNTPPATAQAPTTPDNQPLVTANNSPTDKGPTTSSFEVTREGLAGSWQVPTDGIDCRIILAFTKWSGGYRAATRKCQSPEIQSVNAWDVKDQSVVLVDQSGNQVARLFGTQSGRYDGRTSSGQPISFAR